MTVRERLLSHVTVTDSCWLWAGCLDGGGYGMIFVDGRSRRAHRVLWQIDRGVVPEGLQLDHLCRVRHCVNPDHLEVVTPRENCLRGDTIARRRSEQTHCLRGHLLSGDNVQIINGRNRSCKACARARVKAWKAMRRGLA